MFTLKILLVCVCVLFTPLEQFEAISFEINFTGAYYINIFFVILLICFLVVLYHFLLSVYTKSSFAKGLSFLFKTTRDLYTSNLPSIRKENKTTLTLLFVIIFFCNLLGMFPFSFTITSIFCFTLFLAIYNYIYIIIFTIKAQKWTSFSTLLPAKSIYWIAPLLVLIEAVSYTAKLLSLSLRLFANMVAGHLMLKIIAIFLAEIGQNMCVTSLVTSFFIYGALLLLIILETFLAFLQAYVFTLLSTLYLKEINV